MNDTRFLIRSGDRLYASLSIGSRILAAGMLTGIADLTQLIAHIRKTVSPASGLAELKVRSLTRGWQFSRPLRLYAPAPSPRYALEAAPPDARFPWQL